jgi:hypothetical protein
VGGALGLMDESLNRRKLRIQPPAGDASEEIPSPAIVDRRDGYLPRFGRSISLNPEQSR